LLHIYIFVVQIEAINQTVACIGGVGMFDDLEEAGATGDDDQLVELPKGKVNVGLE
jgi:hypothetical protein